MKTKMFPYFAVLFLTVVTLACSKKDNEPVITFEEPVISLRTYVGWCASNDSLTIGRDNSLWIHYASCSDRVGVKKQWETDLGDYQELMDILDAGNFTALDFDECGHCVDGVTYELAVQQHGERHSIRLSHAYRDQDGMAADLLSKLRDILERLAEKQ